jgi:hypothetical protein
MTRKPANRAWVVSQANAGVAFCQAVWPKRDSGRLTSSEMQVKSERRRKLSSSAVVRSGYCSVRAASLTLIRTATGR